MILVECKPDRALIKLLLETIPSKKIKCVGGKSEVIKSLNNTNHQKLQQYSNVLGLIDEDPGKPLPKIFDNFEKIESATKNDLYLYCHSTNKRYIVSLNPRLEEWILKSAEEIGINVEKYHLPRNPNDFHDMVNASLEKYQKLIQELQFSDRLTSLKSILLEFYS